MMDFRHEWKHEISCADLFALRPRLTAVMQPDAHAVHGRYEIRSMYFDNLQDKALREKIDGVNSREKFRIRYYNADISLILLEKKSKMNGLCGKEKEKLTLEEVQGIASGDWTVAADTKKTLLQELYLKQKIQGLRPKTIVDYTREPFVYAAGNVRVTLDYHIRTGMRCTDFLNPQCVMVPAGDAPIILEVKWETFLPAVIRDIVQIPGTHTSAFSKYAACRIYG
ncbi:MAG: polyphosphate polymerase domain-containing protein [Butyricicoccus porcorum]|uniref:polyphosphate polymerase domain-containing protein n=1 Tax=Butyricicoccus porcorum TaxID=1945634 RepID=UPI003F190EC1